MRALRCWCFVHTGSRQVNPLAAVDVATIMDADTDAGAVGAADVATN